MNGEMFQVVFNSAGLNAVDKTDLNNVIYNVNWGAFLPTKYKKFHCKYVFKSQHFTGSYNLIGFVHMNLGKINCFDGLQKSSDIGIIYPVVLNNVAGSLSTYFNSVSDGFSIDYPQNTNITISLLTFTGTSLANMRDYALILTLVGILD